MPGRVAGRASRTDPPSHHAAMSNPAHLDPNFATSQPGSDLRWYDAKTLPVSGQGWNGDELAQPWDRLPRRAEGVVRPEVWALSRHSAGLSLTFTTDAREISAQWTLTNPSLALDHMPASGVSGLDLYLQRADGWRWAGIARATATTNRVRLAADIPAAGPRTYRLYLPLYNVPSELLIGIPADATLTPLAPDTRKPVVVYGTSIVHGGCASRPGMAYPAILGRALGVPTINLGFSGNGRAEPEVAQLVAELDPSIFVVDPLPNLNAELVSERLPGFVAALRAARPHTPIVLVENITYQHQAAFDRAPRECQRKNAALRAVFAQLSGNMRDLHLVPGEGLLGDDGEATVDGVHPTDLGFTRLAAALTPLLRRLLAV